MRKITVYIDPKKLLEMGSCPESVFFLVSEFTSEQESLCQNNHYTSEISEPQEWTKKPANFYLANWYIIP